MYFIVEDFVRALYARQKKKKKKKKNRFLNIRRRSDYIIEFIAPAIGPNKSKKLTPLIAPTHNIRGKVWMKNNIR